MVRLIALALSTVAKYFAGPYHLPAPGEFHLPSKTLWLALFATLIMSCSQTVYSDTMSVDMGSRGVTYSSEKPNVTKYGTSIGGMHAESSALRWEAESDLRKRLYDEAIRKARKAVQFNSADPETHATLARCLTEKLYACNFHVPKQTYDQCIHEWRLLRWKAPDGFDQTEAAHQLIRLRMAKLTHRFTRNRADKDVDAIITADSRKKAIKEDQY